MGSDNQNVDFSIGDMSFIRLRYRQGTERYLRDPYQPAAKVSTSSRWRLVNLRVRKLQMCRHQVRNLLFCFTKY